MVALVSTAVGSVLVPAKAVPAEARPRRSGATRRTGACSGPSTHATCPSGSSQDVVQFVDQQRSGLLGSQTTCLPHQLARHQAADWRRRPVPTRPLTPGPSTRVAAIRLPAPGRPRPPLLDDQPCAIPPANGWPAL